MSEVQESILGQSKAIKKKPIDLKRMSIEQRFNYHAIKHAGGCWGWRGGRTYQGYGVISVNGKTERAHRLSWKIYRGGDTPRNGGVT